MANRFSEHKQESNDGKKNDVLSLVPSFWGKEANGYGHYVVSRKPGLL